MKKIIIVMSLLLSACGEWDALTYQDPEFSSYILEFQKLSQYDTSKIRIEFSDESDETVRGELGACQKGLLNGNPIRRIKIRRGRWQEASQDSREQLIFHELGHCLLNRSHSDSYVRRGRYVMPTSIMSASQISDEVYKVNRDYYISELVRRLEKGRHSLRSTNQSVDELAIKRGAES